MKDNEKKLSDFIDCLNNEKKPDMETDSEELKELFDVARKIKSLKEPIMPNHDFPNKIIQNLKNEQVAPRKSRKKKTWIGALVSIAAIILIAVFMNFVNPSTVHIVNAMEKSFKKIEAYHGILEVKSKSESGEDQVQTVIDVWVDQHDNYYLEVLEGSYKGLKTISDGEKVWQLPIDENVINVFPIFTETYEFIFDLRKEIEDVKNAKEIEIVDEEQIAGRDTYVLEVTPKGGLTYTLWIDKETNLPLKKESALYNAIQYTTMYKEISIEDAIPERLLAIDTSKGFKEVDLAGNEFVEIIEEDVDEWNPDFVVEVNMEIEKAEQIAADSGSSPWKLDPIYVAQVFVSLQISPEGIVGEYPVQYEELELVKNDGVQAVIEVNNNVTDITKVYLEKLIRQDETGIWTVVGYDK
ncbi:LolA family protein [Ureibacillus thermosphaericus]|uniref:Outer membrane lipoprotein-sorting protein n=1 Tax=Ureibacillus thermosphaericus TaxID=51173 RepID=A0A840Q1C3_URETH|nr:sigma-E factor regulatory protein RseB domain-containing protein [Ureibacillus thermosphaericus]MBB5150268.1 outer membrane lipoprotein-sorting protein [Ureibacillus thermosphaericus]NKZ32879.1 hypothetical protein [Ureibacillus thermosphaericus]